MLFLLTDFHPAECLEPSLRSVPAVLMLECL